jgi:multisubunit Na+/H+ antiporter MnhG subunit
MLSGATAITRLPDTYAPTHLRRQQQRQLWYMHVAALSLVFGATS